jgi:hypothetical protein
MLNKSSDDMKTKMTMGPKVSQKMKRRTILFYTAVTVAFATIVSVVIFTFLNLGNLENAFAAGGTFTSSTSGPWTTNSSWVGGIAPVTTNINGDNITVNTNHTITSGSLNVDNNATFTVKSTATLYITGNLVIQNNLVMNISGTLIITGNLENNNGGNLTINGGGVVKVSGNTTFGNNANVTVNGNLTVGGAISFGSNPTFNGSGFVSTGSGCGSWSGSGSCSLGSLPIKLLSFNAENESTSVKITWKTASEENNNFFTIERSTDGKEFTAIATLPGAGTTLKTSSYEFSDKNPIKGRSYYRLSQTDFDGKSETFNAVTLDVTAAGDEDSGSFQIYPNPLTGTVLNVAISNPANGSIEILDGKGKSILAQNVNSDDNNVELTLDESVTPGVYFVNYKTGSSRKTIRLVKK